MKKMAVALDVAVCFILNILDLLIFDFLLHRTARIVVPLFSFGVVEVEAIYADRPPAAQLHDEHVGRRRLLAALPPCLSKRDADVAVSYRTFNPATCFRRHVMRL